MRHPDTVYRGERIEGKRGEFVGVRVTVAGEPLTLPHAIHVAGGYEWGYGGAGAAQLALALILDATGDPDYACRVHAWFKWAVVACWGPRWQITAGRIREWLVQCEREDRWADEDLDGDQPVCGRAGPLRRCRECGCTEADCRQCIAATGEPCSWVEGEPDLCTRCGGQQDAALIAAMEGGAT